MISNDLIDARLSPTFVARLIAPGALWDLDL